MHPHQNFGHHGGGGSDFSNSNWGGWGGWNPFYSYGQPDVIYSQAPVPTWVYVAGGAVLGIVFLKLIGGR